MLASDVFKCMLAPITRPLSIRSQGFSCAVGGVALEAADASDRNKTSSLALTF